MRRRPGRKRSFRLCSVEGAGSFTITTGRTKRQRVTADTFQEHSRRRCSRTASRAFKRRFSYRRTDCRCRFSRTQWINQASSTARARADCEKVWTTELIDQIVVDVTRTDASAADTFASYRSRFVYALIDGRFANTEADIRLLVGSATLADAAVLYRSNNADDSAVDSLRRITGGLRVSGRIAAPSSNIQQCIVRRTNPANDSVASMPVWGGLELIRDPYSDANKGEVTITGIILVGDVVVLRSGAFVQDSFRLG